jgi:hypothetical protein
MKVVDVTQINFGQSSSFEMIMQTFQNLIPALNDLPAESIALLVEVKECVLDELYFRKYQQHFFCSIKSVIYKNRHMLTIYSLLI